MAYSSNCFNRHMLFFEEMVDCLTWVAPVSLLLRKQKCSAL